MGAFVSYGFEAGLALLSFYLVYRWLLSNQNQPVFNRALLLAGYAGAFLLPAYIPLWRSMLSVNSVEPMSGVVAIEAGEAFIAPGSQTHWADYVMITYYAGALIVLALSMMGVFRLVRVLRHARCERYKDYVLAILADSTHAPFSWLRYVAMSDEDLRAFGSVVMLHEEAHLRACHWIDLLFAQIACVVLWYNPASWLMREELRAVHEYYADRAVLVAGADARTYQLMLIKKAVGRRFPSLANSLNHSKLKKRITMMCNPKSGKGGRIRALAVVPAFALALSVVNIPAVASALSSVASASVENESKVNGKISVQQHAAVAVSPGNPSDDGVSVVGVGFRSKSENAVAEPDVRPQFPGGDVEMYKFLAENVCYPSEALDRQLEGKVVVKFVVEANGKITNLEVLKPVHPLLDAEAVRVVAQFPNWIPGNVDGQPVRCKFSLPVSFKLSPTQSEKNATPAPVVFIDGVRKDNQELQNIAPGNIESVTVRKDNPEYPGGAVYVILKKK